MNTPQGKPNPVMKVIGHVDGPVTPLVGNSIVFLERTTKEGESPVDGNRLWRLLDAKSRVRWKSRSKMGGINFQP